MNSTLETYLTKLQNWAPEHYLLQYLRYVLIHKILVFHYMMIFKCSVYQAVMHDWSKFKISNFFNYAKYYYRIPESNIWDQNLTRVLLDQSWHNHFSTEKHHFEHYVIPPHANEEPTAIPMPHKYILEMMADFCAVTHANEGPDEVFEKTYKWFLENIDPTYVCRTSYIAMKSFFETYVKIEKGTK